MTIYDFIRQRWPNHAQRIIEAAYETDRAGAEHTLTEQVGRGVEPHAVLGCLFIWGCTPEGHEYWKALAEGESKERRMA